uniref:Selenoprotein O n=1 Tax=Tetradesmus obliquus TaxID=3088 RepID=A0A383WE17_TETOB|eukprot:jgi/Sobl393_1/9281/SZX75847.1
MAALEGVEFDNTVLQYLPVDEEGRNEPRPVKGAIYSRVQPTPLADPQLVAASDEALQLLGLNPAQASRDEFLQLMAGNSLLPGMSPASHCYCGYQFGYFAGQLGDGAAIYLGEVVHPSSGTRQELQLKGAGPTPFRRQADGRKVLRSSLREFLASEAMASLGVPTTRAGSLVVSGSDSVLRDADYSGHPAPEPCAVVSRIAPSFIRFGSFELCKAADPVTQRPGPSPGMARTLLLPLLGYTIKQHFPGLWAFYGGGQDLTMAGMDEANVLDMVGDWYAEVCRRTAQLVAGWQGLGFVHGVLNTDNMSILGLTIDYGPYGFMDRFDQHHVSNGSDDAARYCYSAQPAICRWNCERLAEVLGSIPNPAAAAAAADADGAAAAAAAAGGGGGASSSVLPPSRAKRGLQVYDEEMDAAYRSLFRRKLGLVGAAGAAAAAAGANGAGTSAAASAAGPGSSSERPVWPISRSASPAVLAAAAAAAAAAVEPESAVEDDSLIADLLSLMHRTGADFTNTFRLLAEMPMPASSSSSTQAAASSGIDNNKDAAGEAAAAAADGADAPAGDAAAAAAAAGAAAGSGDDNDDFGGLLPLLLGQLAGPAEMAAGAKPAMPLENVQMLMMLAARDPAVLHALGVTQGSLQQQLAAHHAAAKWSSVSAADKAAADEQQWRGWLGRYRRRLQQEADAGVTAELRRALMLAVNPRVVLRNWVAQTAISAAAAGDYAPTRQLLALLRDPFSAEGDMGLLLPPAAAAAGGAAAAAGAAGAASSEAVAAAVGAAAAAAAAGKGGGGAGEGGACPPPLVRMRLDGKPPAWAAKLCVTCSS